MTGFGILAVALAAAGPAGPAPATASPTLVAPKLLVPLVGDPAPPAAGAPRVLVCLPKGSAPLESQVERAFSWAAPTTLGPDNVARRFPPSAAGRAAADDERRLDELLRAAEGDFLALKFDDATARLDQSGKIIDRLPPSARHEAAYVRVQLLQGRIAQARGSARAADAFARAADAAVDVELDEVDYPPAVRQVYKAVRAASCARPRRTVELVTEPAGAEVEVNGQLAGRMPAKLSLSAGRCFLSLTRAGFRTHLAACPAEERTTVTLEPPDRDGLRDQLRERITGDPAWFLEPLLLETLAAEESARWIVVLDRDSKSPVLKALVYSAAERALKPVEPSRLLEGELDKLSAAVRGLVLRSQRLEAQAVDTPTGAPALEARAGDPGLGAAVAYVRRAGSADYLRLGLEARGAGSFRGALPSLLARDGDWDVEYYVEGHDGSGDGETPGLRGGAPGRRSGHADPGVRRLPPRLENRAAVQGYPRGGDLSGDVRSAAHDHRRADSEVTICAGVHSRE